MNHDPKYDHLIDAETWAFIRETERFYPPDAVNLTVADQRRVYRDLCAALAPPMPDGVDVTNFAIDSDSGDLPCRRYIRSNARPLAQVLFFHGGGFVVGDLDTHNGLCADLCDRTGLPITAVDYRLAPEHTFPADFEDAMTALRHVTAETDLPVILVGDSAGGTLAAAAAHAARHETISLGGQVLIYPSLSKDTDWGSFLTHANAPMLTTQDMAYYADIRVGGDLSKLSRPDAMAGEDTDFSGLPPTFVFSAEIDPLHDDGGRYCDRINQAGGIAYFTSEAGLPHGYLHARHRVARAATAFDNIVAALKELGSGSTS